MSLSFCRLKTRAALTVCKAGEKLNGFRGNGVRRKREEVPYNFFQITPSIDLFPISNEWFFRDV